MYQQKVEGGTCTDCGAKYVKNPKTGKVFCENKCWLTAGQVQPQNSAGGVKSPYKGDKAPDWDKIALGKVRHGIACAFIQAGRQLNPVELNQWVDWVMQETKHPEGM